MWKPAEVIPEDKRRAIAVWVIIIFAILGYSGYLVYDAVEQTKNPSTSFELSNDLYEYPDVYVCLYDFYGCDSFAQESQCMASYNMTEGGVTRAKFNPDGDREQDIEVLAHLTEERGWCVELKTSEIEMESGDRDPEDYVLINMYWYPGGAPNNSTTCIVGDGDWESHSESVFSFLRDPDTEDLSAGVQVAYSCITNASNSHIFNYMGIGLTKEVKISGDHTATYSALATSSATYKDKRTENITGITAPYAYLSMEIAQQTDSLVTITEINPLEIAEIIGQIGGFWDLLLILWPIFFVTAARQDPHLKVRNFKKSVKKGAEAAKHLSVSVGLAVSDEPKRRGARDDGGEDRPSWDFVAPALEEKISTPGASSRHPMSAASSRPFSHFNTQHQRAHTGAPARAGGDRRPPWEAAPPQNHLPSASTEAPALASFYGSGHGSSDASSVAPHALPSPAPPRSLRRTYRVEWDGTRASGPGIGKRGHGPQQVASTKSRVPLLWARAPRKSLSTSSVYTAE